MEKNSPGLVKKYGSIAFAIIVLLLVAFVPLPESLTARSSEALTQQGRLALGVLFFCLTLWVTEPMPFHITGIIGLLLLTFLRVDSFASIVRFGFGNDIVVFFIGVLVLSAFITRSGLGRRVSMFMLSKTGNSTSGILLGFLLVGALLSMWITCLASAAIMTPLAKTLLEDEKLEPGKTNFGRGLTMAAAWGPLIGGIATPAGSGPNPIAIGFMRDIAGIDISFLDWMVFGVPASLLLILPAWFLLRKFFKPEMARLGKSREQMKAEFATLPKMTFEEKATLTIFVITVALWLSSPVLSEALGIAIPTSLPAILGACLFFLPGISKQKWADISHGISWSSIILIATGISIGMMVYNTGAARWLSVLLFGSVVGYHPLVMIFLILLIIAVLKIGLSSNTVTATIITPIIITLAQSYEIPVMTIAMPANLTLSLAFILVTSSPTNIIPYATGYFKLSDMAKAGTVMTIAASAIITLVIYGIGRMTGLY